MSIVLPSFSEAASTAPQQISASTVAAPAAINGVRSTKVIGYSRQHRPIVAYEMGNPAAPFRTVVMGSMHGYYERAGEQVTAAMLKLPIPSSIHLWVIPTMNPDGDALHQRGNASGVDLNRNFPVGWTYVPPSSDKFGSHYSGPAALSEPETRAIYSFLGTIKPNRMVSMHQPLDGVDTTDGGARDISFRNALSSGLGLPLKAFTCLSTCRGTMTRWLTAAQTGAAITVEFRQDESSSYLTGQVPRAILAALAIGVKLPPLPVMSGHLDTIRATPGAVTVIGWVLDPQRTSTPGSASVTVDGVSKGIVSSNVSRPDVNRSKGVTGSHGFSFSVRATPGNRRICVYARSAGSTSATALLGTCHVVTVWPFTFDGKVDRLTGQVGAVRIVGWALDPLYPARRAWVRIFVDGRAASDVNTSLVRADVNRARSATGAHGFDVTLRVKPGNHTITAVPLQIGTSTLPARLRAVTVTVAVPAK
ncbi:hypothetical protein ABIB25_005106 [Nakamurella sp. UYEF19]|uniref:M14 family zinc carboxypeptidase n=1 Tax=Nakamurella sp. UYEF19 TaxID=1756392 RepID=UPI003392087B